ncbi:MAG TPA: nucleotidyltransferase domain-containing protein [Candidatus Binatia bacterium]
MKIRKPNSNRVKARNNTEAAASPVTPGLLREITQKVVHAFRPKNIIMFGSYAYGKPTSDSDLDLLIIMESRDRPAERIRKVSDLFDPRPLPMDFIVLTPGEMRHRLSGFDPFLEEVLAKGQMLYGSDT